MTVTLDLPMPPSANNLWRSNRGRVHKSATYVKWLKEAGLIWLTQKPKQPKDIIPANFNAVLLLNEEKRGQKDLDNRAKAMLDFCKIHGIVADDKYLDDLRIKWGPAADAPLGARLIVTGVA